MASTHPRNPTLLDHLKKTYKWLNDHAQDAEQFLRQCTDDGIPLFLNVDDPTKEEWNWKKGDHILVDEYDKYDTGHLECPRDFLKAFRSLLVAAGAITIDYGAGIERQEPTTVNYAIHHNATLNQMRRDRICTDISFVCDPPDGEPVFAHRACLAACSSYFRIMFSGSFLEADSRHIAQPFPIPDSSRCCIEYVLGKIPSVPCELHLTANRLCVYRHNPRDKEGRIRPHIEDAFADGLLVNDRWKARLAETHGQVKDG